MRPVHISVSARSQATIWIAFTIVLSAVFVALTVPALDRYPAVSGDDSWIMSASFKLATTGVFGSDLYAGFHGAGQHYFIALPVYQLLQALSFVLLGAGIMQARLVTVGSAIVVLWATTWLALRWYGLSAAVICGLLLVALRVNLVGIWPGIPLVAVGRTGRYDMTGLAFTWLTIVFLDLLLQQPESRRTWAAYATGICAGLATLTQFFGIFTLLIIALTLALTYGRQMRAAAVSGRIVVGWALVVVPYLLYVAVYWPAFRGQAVLKAGRTDFLDVRFYMDNLRDEGARYQHLLDTERMLGSGVANWLFVIAIWPIVGWIAWREWRLGRLGDRLLLVTLAVGSGALALIDSTNVPLYTIVVWPGCCIAIAAAIASGLGWACRRWAASRSATQRVVLTAGLVVMLAAGALLAADGVNAYREDRRRAEAASSYEDVAARLDAALPAGVGVVGHQRWWWGLHERDYLALDVLKLEWAEQADMKTGTPSFANLFDATGAGALIVDDNVRSEMTRYPAELQRQIVAFLRNQAEPAIVITDPTYGRFDIYVLR